MEGMEEREKNDNLISLLGNSSAINNRFSLFIIWSLFLCVLFFSFFVIYLQFSWKNIDTWLLEIFLTTLGILFVISYLAFEARYQKTANFFVKNFYKNFNEELIKQYWFEIYSRKVKENNYYKDLLKNKDLSIWINLEYDNFYFRAKSDIINKLVENWAIKLNKNNAWLWINCPDSYKKRILQLQEYINFANNNLK